MELEKILLGYNKKTNELYIEEKNIVFGTIVNKLKNSTQATAIRITIGYILPNNNIYDFETENIYKIYNKDILQHDEEVFLVSHKIFTTNRRIKLKSYKTEIQPLLDNYLKEQQKNNDLFREDLVNPEYVPIKKYTKQS